MKRQQLILIILAVLTVGVCLGAGWFLVSAWMANKEAASVRNADYAAVQKIYRGKVFPDPDTIARVKEDQKALESWLATASNLLHQGDLHIESKSPTGFKQTLQATVRALSARPGAANGRIVAPGFLFGFDQYLGESDSLPAPEHVDRLTGQLTIIERLCNELCEAGVLEIKAVQRETFDAQTEAGGPDRSQEASSSRRRRRRDEPQAQEAVAPAARKAASGEFFSKQRFSFEFLARPPAFIGALNRLAAMDLFVVVAEAEFRKTDDPIGRHDTRKKEGAASAADAATKEVDLATIPHADRIVTDPDLDPPVNVRLNIDVYSFEGV
jgi:hypothetical protein